MSNSVEQTQKGGSESTNVQAGQVVIHQHALSYQDVKNIALDVFKNNFEQLSAVARETARARAEEITDKFLQQLEAKNKEGIKKAETPEFQMSLLTVQKEYVRTGDRELGALLVDLLVDITKGDQRDILQIVLEECLTVAPKLTIGQIASLAIIFAVRYCQRRDAISPEKLAEVFSETVNPFVSVASKSITTFQHLEYSGCGTAGIGEIKLSEVLAMTYAAVFSRPFKKEEFEAAVPEAVPDGTLIPSTLESGKWQFGVNSTENLEEAYKRLGIGNETLKKAIQFWSTRRIGESEIREKAIEWYPEMRALFDLWDESRMKHFTLTSVGIGIAHAAVRSRTGFDADLSVWI